MHEEAEDVLLPVGETRGRAVMLGRARVTFRWAAVLTRCDAYGDDRPRPEVVFYGNAPMGEGEIFLDKGQPASHPSNVSFHGVCGGREPRHLGFLFLGNARALVGEPDGVSSVVYRNNDFAESGMNEVLAYFSDNGVGDGPARLLRLRVDCGGKALDEFRCCVRCDFGNTWCAAEIVVACDARGSECMGKIVAQ